MMKKKSHPEFVRALKARNLKITVVGTYENCLSRVAVSIIGKTKCDGIQNQMRLFGGRVSPKRKATKISHTHTKKHRSNGF